MTQFLRIGWETDIIQRNTVNTVSKWTCQSVCIVRVSGMETKRVETWFDIL